MLLNKTSTDIQTRDGQRKLKRLLSAQKQMKKKTFREDLAEAIQVALQFDDEIFMESAVDQVLLLYIFLIVCTRSIEESYTVYSSYSLNIVFISKNS